jgi:hypothetical protein
MFPGGSAATAFAIRKNKSKPKKNENIEIPSFSFFLQFFIPAPISLVFDPPRSAKADFEHHDFYFFIISNSYETQEGSWNYHPEF